MGKISLLVILLFGLGAGAATRRLAFDDDEFQHAHMAWLLARGEVPHRDFFEHHLPLYHFLLAPFTLGDPEPERILCFRAISVLLAMGTLACTARAIRNWNGGDSPGILALIAFSPIFFVKMTEVRPEGLCLLLGTAALATLKKPGRVLIPGLLAGAMVMGSQKFVFLAAGLFLLAWREHGSRALLRFCAGGAAVPLLFGLHYLFTGSLAAAWRDLVVMNLNWKEHFSPAMYGTLFWSGSALLIVSGVLGLISGGDPGARRAARLLLLSGLAAVMMVPIPFRQTFLMLYPGLALGGALCWRRLSGAIAGKERNFTAGILLTLTGLLPASARLYTEFQNGPEDDLAMMDAMEARGNRPVFDGRGLMFTRQHVGFYPWMHQGLMLMLDPEEHARQSIEAIVEADYPDVLWDYRVDMMSPALHAFLQTRYVPVSPEPLWVPGRRIDRARLRTGTRVELEAGGAYLVDWQGGRVRINGEEVTPGDRLDLDAGTLYIQGEGFIRNFIIHRAGGSE